MNAVTQPEFSATVEGQQLVARSIKGDVSMVLCSIDLRRQPTFFIQQNVLMCRETWGNDFAIEHESGLAHDLLEQIVLARAVVKKRPRRWKLMCTLALIVAAAAGGYYLGGSSRTVDASQETTAVVAAPTADAKPQPAQRSIFVDKNEPGSRAAADGWELPSSTRSQLPTNLAKAAGRELFTVEYSSGHPRTIYIFADPSCPNCQRLEPALESASDAYNVVVFPVSVIGKEMSIAAATSVLCLPPADRKQAWSGLFDPGRDVLKLGQRQEVETSAVAPAGEESNCDMANKALGVNDVAYRSYRIPGTPWAITDDGRHVPQEFLRDQAKLQKFINAGVKADDAE